MITANDSKAIVPSLDKAKQAGMLVIALDTPVDPPGTPPSRPTTSRRAP